MNISIKWNGNPKSIINKRILRNGNTALFMAETWRRLVNPFVPMDSGFLANDSTSISSEGSTGYIHYVAPYAGPVYYGTRMNFQTHKHPLASAKWDKAAIRSGKYKTLVSDTDAYIKGS